MRCEHKFKKYRPKTRFNPFGTSKGITYHHYLECNKCGEMIKTIKTIR